MTDIEIRTIPVRNPRTGATEFSFPAASPREVAEKAARLRRNQRAWARPPHSGAYRYHASLDRRVARARQGNWGGGWCRYRWLPYLAIYGVHRGSEHQWLV